MRQWLDRYYGRLRKIKLNYVVLNFFNLRRLAHTRRMYRRYGIQRSVLLPISSRHMPSDPGTPPWLDAPDAAEALARRSDLSRFTPEIQEGIRRWPEKGYLILRNCFSGGEVERMNSEVDKLLHEGRVAFNFTGRKIMFAFKHSRLLNTIVHDRRILDVMDLLLGKHMKPFQSINFLTGSEQAAHSDSIHMTTYPLGYLAAAWIALEPMTPDNGPLIYYPGSHRLPYLLNNAYDHGGDRFIIGEDAYARYEKAVEERVRSGGFRAEEFLAAPGDVLIWHANLLHGGKRMSRPDASRKSMAVHYFADDVVCYHELTQRAALMDEAEVGA